MKLKHWWIVCCTVGLIGTASAEPQRTAVIGGSSQSLYFGPFNHSDSSGRALTSFFTTDDGKTDRFPTNQTVGFSALFSGEVRPSTNQFRQPGDYTADIATRNASGWSEYGSFTVTLPTDDSDLN